MSNIIETHNLTKRYRDFTAVNKLNMHVKRPGLRFSGAKRSRKIHHHEDVPGAYPSFQRQLQIKGRSYPKDRMKILRETGAFIESPAFYGNLTGEENLDIIRRILGLPKSSIKDALELTGLYEFRKRTAGKYSLGMKQRLGLAEALLGRPPLLILDEPTNGLDPAGIHEIRTLIRSLPQKYNCTVLVSSHLLSEIELMADDIGILNHGRLLFEGTLPELKEQAAQMGYPTDNLEDTFLAMIQEDNLKRGDKR